MLKHATICRTNRAQQALKQQAGSIDVVDHAGSTIDNSGDLNNNSESQPSPTSGNWLTTTRVGTSCSSSPTPSFVTTPTGRFAPNSSAPTSVFNSPSKPNPSSQVATVYRSSSDSMIKIFAQTLSQEVEYVTLHLNAQTKSQQIIRTLLKKFRLKHRDPNLFYLTLERWIRKDGIKFKSVMLLSDDACPLQLQQCCSNPPHNDIKFTLQMRSGALIKIFCSDVCSDTKYKCLSLSSQTTVEDTIGLMLHCLNLTIDCESKQGNTSNETITQNLDTTSAISHHHRQVSSPSSTGSSSSASSTSSSSGIESDLMNQNTCPPKTMDVHHQQASRRLDANSRTSSVTSISSASNVSSSSINQTFSEHYCLVIECENTSYKRVLEADEYLVEVYQGLLDEACERSNYSTHAFKSVSSVTSGSNITSDSIKLQPDQWFIIKLKRRDDLMYPSVKFTNPRQNMPLPPIPPSLAQFNSSNDLQFFVSTTQIEVNHHQRRLGNCYATPVTRANSTVERGTASVNKSGGQSALTSTAPSATTVASAVVTSAHSRPINCHQKQMSAVVTSSYDKMPPPPKTLLWLPPIMPRRRNLSNASTTFGRPQNGLATGVSCNRRRYDPAQLADDLNQLNLGVCGGSSDGSSACSSQARSDDSTSDTLFDSKPVIKQATCASGTPNDSGDRAETDEKGA